MTIEQKRNALLGAHKTRQSSVAPVQKEDGMEFVFISSDNTGTRYDWETGKFYEEVLDPAGADTSRFKTIFKDHVRSVDNAVARVDSTSVEDNQLVGKVVFSSDDDAQTIKRKYEEGILTDVSVGYIINDYKVEEREGQPDLVTVTNYEVFEASFVGVGFDQGAQKRSEDEVPQEVIERLTQAESNIKEL